MTFDEVLERKLRRIRLPQWNEHAFLQIEYVDLPGNPKAHGAMGCLVGPYSQWWKNGPQAILLTRQVTAGDGWLEYTGQPDRACFPEYRFPE